MGIDYDPVKGKYGVTGLCFDLYGEYKVSNWKFIGHVPVTFRFTDDEEKASIFRKTRKKEIQVILNMFSVPNMILGPSRIWMSLDHIFRLEV